ncbi:hypothetical protein CGRA01v4_03715 [Colletotrichum graminicola]|nr:hypothetical protein CGRA01v4_03715 [Colletotrichum graminicola]
MDDHHFVMSLGLGGGALRRNGIVACFHISLLRHFTALPAVISLLSSSHEYPLSPSILARVSPRYLKWKKFALIALATCIDNKAALD